MAISKKNEKVIHTGGQISLASSAAPGLAQADAGAALQRLGKASFDEATQSVRSAVFADNTNKATLEFNQRLQERLSSNQDENGNPTFQNLPDDIGNLGKEINDKYAGQIIDPVARQQFSQSFAQFTTNRQIAGLSQARTQLLQFQREKMATSLQGFVEQASVGPEDQISEIGGRLDGVLNAMVSSGAITPEDRFNMKEQFRKQVTTNRIRAQINSNPHDAKKILESDNPISSSLHENERQRFIKEADAGIRDAERTERRAAVEQESAERQRRAVANAQLKTGVQEGITGEKQLEEARNNKAITEIQYQDRRRQLIAEQRIQDRANKTNLEIAGAIEGERSLHKFTPGQINKYYQQRIAIKTSANGDKALTLEDKASIALTIKAPITNLTGEIDAAVRFGDPKKAGEAVRAYSMLKEKNPQAIDKINAKTEATLVVAQRLVSNSNLSYEKATIEARKIVLEADSDIQQERQRELTKLEALGGALSNKNIDSTVTSFVQRRLADQGLFKRSISNTPLAPGLRNQVKTLLKDAFLLTGNMEDAQAMVDRWLGSRVGVSEINGSDHIMKFPPEKMTGLRTEQIRAQIESDAAPLLPKGIPPKNVVIESDAKTNREVEGGSKVISYPVGYKDENGLIQPILDDKGKVKRYVPDSRSVRQEEQKAEEAKLKSDREQRAIDIENVRESGIKGLATGKRQKEPNLDNLRPTDTVREKGQSSNIIDKTYQRSITKEEWKDVQDTEIQLKKESTEFKGVQKTSLGWILNQPTPNVTKALPIDIPQNKIAQFAQKVKESYAAKGHKSNSRHMIVVDFTKHNNKQRMHIVDLESNKVISSMRVAHGAGSDPNRTGRVQSVSNMNNSHKSSKGGFRTGGTYVGKHGRSIKMIGLDKGVNDKAFARHIVIHSSKYVRPGRVGYSWGCLAVSKKHMEQIHKLISKGSMIYINYDK